MCEPGRARVLRVVAMAETPEGVRTARWPPSMAATRFSSSFTVCVPSRP
ncbi:Uncharacterised protein [Bordetella pertussis]|nr:Uncharacterised protein [Bordetella pertussis]CPM50851.1 Uncharacterised protein [Bordetella pertussis]